MCIDRIFRETSYYSPTVQLNHSLARTDYSDWYDSNILIIAFKALVGVATAFFSTAFLVTGDPGSFIGALIFGSLAFWISNWNSSTVAFPVQTPLINTVTRPILVNTQPAIVPQVVVRQPRVYSSTPIIQTIPQYISPPVTRVSDHLTIDPLEQVSVGRGHSRPTYVETPQVTIPSVFSGLTEQASVGRRSAQASVPLITYPTQSEERDPLSHAPVGRRRG